MILLTIPIPKDKDLVLAFSGPLRVEDGNKDRKLIDRQCVSFCRDPELQGLHNRVNLDVP